MTEPALLTYDDGIAVCHQGDALTVLATLPAESVQCVVTSPPYWGLRDYGAPGQLGLEPTPEEYVANMVAVFREVRRVLRKDGTCWLNLGDSYSSHDPGGARPGEFLNPGGREAVKTQENGSARNRAGQYHPFGLKRKDLVGIPWRVAFALQADGWWLRSDIVWSKPNPMPESVTDRPTKSHEYVFLLTRSERYYFDADAVREAAEYGRREWSNTEAVMAAATFAGDTRSNHGVRTRASVTGGDPSSGRNVRTVWTIATQPYPEAHFATFPEALAERCIRAGTKPQDVVLDPFAGSGTTLAVAKRLDRRAVGIELKADYLRLIRRRVGREAAQITLDALTGAP